MLINLKSYAAVVYYVSIYCVRRISRQQNNTDLWYGLLHNAGSMLLDTLCIHARLMSKIFLCCDYPNKCT